MRFPTKTQDVHCGECTTPLQDTFPISRHGDRQLQLHGITGLSSLTRATGSSVHMNFREDIPGSRKHVIDKFFHFVQMQFSNLRYSKLLVSNCIQLQNKTIYSRLQNCMGTELFIASCKQNTFGSPTIPCQLDHGFHGSTGILLWNFWGYLKVASHEVVTDSLLQVK